jgi:hypothetical protein
LAAGAIVGWMPLTLAILALLTHVTVFQRIHYCWKHLSTARSGPSQEGKQP